MERFTISKSEKQTIYEIYRACRLCGAGGGYRMPIIQNIVDLESSDVELRQKIQECLQLEVRQDDRMPPLICELCVDKVNDFYEFFNLARQTNVRTRTRLGLPLQIAKKGEPEQSDCILGVTEPVYVKDDKTKSKAGPKCSKKIKKEPDVVKVKTEIVSDSSRSSSVSSRGSRARVASPPLSRARAASPPPARACAASTPPAPATRERRGKPEPPKPAQQTTKEKDKKTPKELKKEVQTLLEQTAKEKDKKTPKERKSEVQTLLEDITKFEEPAPLVPRATKRTREEPPRAAPPHKRTKAPPPKEPEREPSPPRSRPGPKSKKKPEPKAEPPKEKAPAPQKQNKTPKSKAKPESAKAKETPKPPEDETPKGPVQCTICDAQLKTIQAYGSHLKSHTPTYTKPANACNPCGKWFVTTEEAATHHRYHRAVTFPYHCRRCFEDYRTLQLYNDHISQGQCKPWEETPDVKCDKCWGSFPTQPLLSSHKCAGVGGRPGGKCQNCSRSYATLRSLKKHESSCKPKKKRDLIADPDVLRRLKPMRVRIRRCDDLFSREIDGHYDVSAVKPNYGLAKDYVYPYLKFSPVKTEPLHHDSMVAIPVALKEEFATDYTHWDSEDSDSETILRRVPALSTLAIKKLFSKHCLGKVPRRRKRVKNEAFENDDFANMTSDINDLISSLGDDMGSGNLGRKDLTARIKDIIGCLDDSMDGSANIDGNDDSGKIVDEASKEGDVTNRNGNNSVDNVNESTKEHLTQSNECNDSVEASSVEISRSVENSDKVINNNSNDLNKDNENEDSSHSETVINKDNLALIDINKEIGESIQGSTENLIEMVTETKESENVSVNGISESNSHFIEEKKSEEISKQVNKESPIKHSIENLIGDNDKNPDKYISEVISSIEDIINKTPRNDDSHEQLNGQTELNNSNVMDVLDNISEDAEKRISDQDKITLEDLLPNEDRQMDLDEISDDDFNFDA